MSLVILHAACRNGNRLFQTDAQRSNRRSAARDISVDVSPIAPQTWFTAVYTRTKSTPGSTAGIPEMSRAFRKWKLFNSVSEFGWLSA